MVSLGPFQCQSGPLTQFVFGRFFLKGYIVPLRRAIRRNFSMNVVVVVVVELGRLAAWLLRPKFFDEDAVVTRHFVQN